MVEEPVTAAAEAPAEVPAVGAEATKEEPPGALLSVGAEYDRLMIANRIAVEESAAQAVEVPAEPIVPAEPQGHPRTRLRSSLCREHAISC